MTHNRISRLRRRLDPHQAFALDCAEIAAEKLNTGRMDRRTFVKVMGLLGVAPAALAGRARAAEGEIVIVNWGGPAVDAYHKAFGVPFEEASGLEVVIDGTGPLGSKIKAMVEAGAVVWDVCDTGLGTTLNLGDAGVLEEIDYDVVDKSKFNEEFAYVHGVPNYLFSYVLAYNSEEVDRAPTSWADFFDFDTFPGFRTMRQQPDGQMEAVLLSEGIAPEDLYPLDIDRAIAKIREVKDDIIFWTSGSMSQQLFRQREVVMGNIWHTRANLVRGETGEAVDWIWDGGILTAGMWNVPKGNPAGKDAAMRFIASSQDPEQQVMLLEMMGNGPANPAAAALVPEAFKRVDPGQPAAAAVQVPFNGYWWRENLDVATDKWLEAISS